MGISLFRFIKNPKASIEKSLSIVKRYHFSKDINDQLNKRDLNVKSDMPLDLLYRDNRDRYNTVIDKIRCISTNILSMIDHLSKQYNFNYFLAYGTLIGAVRHRDFIPWDDDIDIMMTQEDLYKLIAVSALLPSYIEIKVMDNNFVKVMDKNSKISLDGKRGVAVDIFVLDTKEDEYSFRNVHNQKWVKTLKADWYPTTMHPFGEKTFSIPKNYDEILTEIYGDYMKLPPEEDRVYSHIDESKTTFISPNEK
jgi:phosphorylcholine metabolism protein LicD